MKELNIKLTLAVVICLLMALSVFAQNDKTTSTETKQVVEVQKFDIKQGIEFPVTLIDVMMAEIVDELKKLNKFSQVQMQTLSETTKADKTEGEPKLAQTIEPNLILSGTITKYEAGNRAARYLIGFGAGKTKIVALIKVVDKATGKIVFEKSVDGKVIIGLFGGDSNGATRGLAKEVASVVKKSVK
ncbi:MAG TPA: DUF4410 domain-containing protein [Pyrinomonadaceae bacterium]|nr:DUF4410 domain-containing protein [Pyrinomonadaceae bacterium]